ncbi:hypothetical protein JCM8547_001791 [Rhodosporidiobolus lusitaniae]
MSSPVVLVSQQPDQGNNQPIEQGGSDMVPVGVQSSSDEDSSPEHQSWRQRYHNWKERKVAESDAESSSEGEPTTSTVVTHRPGEKHIIQTSTSGTHRAARRQRKHKKHRHPEEEDNTAPVSPTTFGHDRKHRLRGFFHRHPDSESDADVTTQTDTPATATASDSDSPPTTPVALPPSTQMHSLAHASSTRSSRARAEWGNYGGAGTSHPNYALERMGEEAFAGVDGREYVGGGAGADGMSQRTRGRYFG